VPGTRTSNTVRPTQGRVGFWAMTTDPGARITLAIDTTANVTADRGVPKTLIADGQWHLYEWSLDHNHEWEGWFNGTGILDYPDFTLDSIQILGRHNDATIYLDDVFHTTQPLPGSCNMDLNQDGRVDGADAGVLFSNWTNPGIGDCDSDGTVDGADLAQLYAAWTGDLAPAAGIPEPSFVRMVLAAAVGHVVRRRAALGSPRNSFRTTVVTSR